MISEKKIKLTWFLREGDRYDSSDAKLYSFETEDKIPSSINITAFIPKHTRITLSKIRARGIFIQSTDEKFIQLIQKLNREGTVAVSETTRHPLITFIFIPCPSKNNLLEMLITSLVPKSSQIPINPAIQASKFMSFLPVRRKTNI